MTLAKEQEILMNIADMLMYTYISESILLRTEKLVMVKGEAACANQLDMMRVYINDAADKINVAGKDAINSFAEGDARQRRSGMVFVWRRGGRLPGLRSR